MKRYTTEIIVDMGGSMQMLDSRGDNEGGNRPAPAPRQQQPQQQYQQQSQQPQQQQYQQQQAAPQRPAPSVQQDAQPAPDYDSFDDDIPF